MKFIKDDSTVWGAIAAIKEEYMAALVRGEDSIDIDCIEHVVKTLVREMEGNAAYLHMQNEITRRKTNAQEARIKTMWHKINKLETEVSILKGEPQPEVGENG